MGKRGAGGEGVWLPGKGPCTACCRSRAVLLRMLLSVSGAKVQSLLRSEAQEEEGERREKADVLVFVWFLHRHQ